MLARERKKIDSFWYSHARILLHSNAQNGTRLCFEWNRIESFFIWTHSHYKHVVFTFCVEKKNYPSPKNNKISFNSANGTRLRVHLSPIHETQKKSIRFFFYQKSNEKIHTIFLRHTIRISCTTLHTDVYSRTRCLHVHVRLGIKITTVYDRKPLNTEESTQTMCWIRIFLFSFLFFAFFS